MPSLTLTPPRKPWSQRLPSLLIALGVGIIIGQGLIALRKAIYWRGIADGARAVNLIIKGRITVDESMTHLRDGTLPSDL